MQIKHIISTMTLIVLSMYAANGQWNAGIRVGTHLSNTTATGIIDDVLPMDWKAGPEIGASIEKFITPQLSVVSGLQYSSKGFTINEGFDFSLLGINIPVEVSANTKLNYIETPLALKYNITDGRTRPYVLGGISPSYATGGKIQPVATFILDFNLPEVNIDFSDNNFARWNVAAMIGAGVEHSVATGKIFADITYKHGMTDVVTNTIVDLGVKNKGLSLGIGYAHSF